MSDTPIQFQNNPGNSSRFRGQVLRQVYRVWLFRKLLPVVLGEIVVLSIVLYQLGQMVFVQRVLENGLTVLFSNPPEFLNFVFSLAVKGSITARILGVGVLLLMAFLVRHLTQAFLRLFLVRENYFGKVSKSQ